MLPGGSCQKAAARDWAWRRASQHTWGQGSGQVYWQRELGRRRAGAGIAGSGAESRAQLPGTRGTCYGGCCSPACAPAPGFALSPGLARASLAGGHHVASSVPSLTMPTARHFWKRQNWHRFRRLLSTGQSLLARQMYLAFFCTVRCREQEKQGSASASGEEGARDPGCPGPGPDGTKALLSSWYFYSSGPAPRRPVSHPRGRVPRTREGEGNTSLSRRGARTASAPARSHLQAGIGGDSTACSWSEQSPPPGPDSPVPPPTPGLGATLPTPDTASPPSEPALPDAGTVAAPRRGLGLSTTQGLPEVPGSGPGSLAALETLGHGAHPPAPLPTHMGPDSASYTQASLHPPPARA